METLRPETRRRARTLAVRRQPRSPGGLHTRRPDGTENPIRNPGWFSDQRFKKADLHCHSVYSTFKYFRIANTRDSYNRPEDVYRLAKQRGMDYVTLTDHDSIDGCLYLLDKHPDLTTSSSRRRSRPGSPTRGSGFT